MVEGVEKLSPEFGASQNATVLVNEEELSRWPKAAVEGMKSQKLLLKARPADSVVCPGCEQQCTMPVHTLTAGKQPATLFIVCDKRDDINRVAVAGERLRQWRCGEEDVCRFVARALGMRFGGHRKTIAGRWELGLVLGEKRSQMLCLGTNVGELELVAGNNAIPLGELLRYGKGGYVVDGLAVRQLADAATTGDKRYTPNNVRREMRKLETQALRESWKKEYRALRKRRPGMSDVWYSKQIEKQEIAKDRGAETIRKHMK